MSGAAPARSTFTSALALADRVTIDGDPSLVGTVTGLQFRLTRSPVAEVSYFHNGEARSAWIEEWRLAPAADA